MADYVVREPGDIEEFGQLAAVFQAVFCLADRATPPAWLMEDSTKAGGLTLGLWHGDQAVGFSYAFAGLDAGGPYLYSSGLGVLPPHRSQGRAYAMKAAQRELALERGYRRMRWTYSALRSVNAHLYLTRLGGLGGKYIVDTRGSFDSDWVTEGGIPLDEFAVDWDLDSDRVRSRLGGSRAAGLEAARRISRCSGPARERVLEEIDGGASADRVLCEIPADFQSLVTRAPELARDWRMKTRPAFAQLMEAGYLLTECQLEASCQVPFYVFEKARDGNA
jgi:predicted GNAT superfamily acetyltransferase